MKFWRVFHVVAKVAKPILTLIGVAPKSTASKVADAAALVDSAVEAERKAKS